MVKSYLRYEPLSSFGLVAGHTSAPAVIWDGTTKVALAAACENVLVWDVRKGALLATWKGEKAEVTCLARRSSGDLVAVGYSDGSIRLWSTSSHSYTVAFNGHKGAVTALAFDAEGTRLASGGRDTCVIVWDVVGEQGLFRLKGHRDAVTALAWVGSGRHVFSASKDNLVKVWDTTTQHCVETLTGHRGEVWSLAFAPDEAALFTGCADGLIHMWRIDRAKLANAGATEELACESVGSVQRASSERITSVRVDDGGRYLVAQSNDRSIEVYRILDEAECKRKKLRKRRRRREKARTKEEQEEEAGADEDEDEDSMLLGLMAKVLSFRTVVLEASDLLASTGILRAAAKINSFDMLWSADRAKGGLQLVLALYNNSLATYSVVPTSKSEVTTTLLASLELPGHRSDIRAIAVSSDDQMLASASSDMLKIWNLKTKACIRSMDSGYALCCAFVPGNRHVLVGTKAGRLELFDIASSTLLQSEEAHSGAVWTIALAPDGKSFISGSADKDVKFWEFELTERTAENGQVTRTLGIEHVRTLKMSDEVLAVKISPDGRLLAVSLLDSTIKVFFVDTLKFFLSLFGHKLPALALDISFDSRLLISGSADKTIKVWGLDFGDCHKSLLAHADSVVQVRFVPETHYFWSSSKDRVIKEWDGDKFQHIMTLEGHLGEVWALVVSSKGDFIVSASHDRSIRVWERTEEQLFLEEEREKQLEAMFEAPPAEDQAADSTAEARSAGKQTTEKLVAGERLVEALELADEEWEKLREYEAAAASSSSAIAPPPPHPMLVATRSATPSAYVLHVIASIRSSDLEQALLILSFANLRSMFAYIEDWGWKLELCCRVLLFLLHMHHNQIVANRAFRPTLSVISNEARRLLHKLKDLVGFNLAALESLRHEYETTHNARFFDAPQVKVKSVKKQKIK